jgi:hypothetical protein
MARAEAADAADVADGLSIPDELASRESIEQACRGPEREAAEHRAKLAAREAKAAATGKKPKVSRPRPRLREHSPRIRSI